MWICRTFLKQILKINLQLHSILYSYNVCQYLSTIFFKKGKRGRAFLGVFEIIFQFSTIIHKTCQEKARQVSSHKFYKLLNMIKCGFFSYSIENAIKFLCYTEVPKFHCTLKNYKFETLIQRVDCHDITEILLKVALNTINHKNHQRVGYWNPQPHPYQNKKMFFLGNGGNSKEYNCVSTNK